MSGAAGGGANGGGGTATGGGGAASNGGDAGASAGGGSTGVAGSGGSTPNDFCSMRAGLAFCDDFEKQPLGAAQAAGAWTPSINGDGTLEIDGSVAHSGKQSLKVHGSGFSTFLVLSVDTLLASATSALHVRAYVRMAEPMTGGHNTLLVADLKAAPGAGNAFRLGEMNAMLMYTVSGDTHGALANDNYYTDHLPRAAFTPMAWNCVELVLDHQKPEISVALGDSAILDLHHTDWQLDAYDTLRFGFEKYAGPLSDVWYDDIAIGMRQVGCDL